MKHENLIDITKYIKFRGKDRETIQYAMGRYMCHSVANGYVPFLPTSNIICIYNIYRPKPSAIRSNL